MNSTTPDIQRADLKSRYEKLQVNKIWHIILALVFLILISLVSLQIGIADVSIPQIIVMVWKLISGKGMEAISVDEKIVLLLRFPRILLGILSGAALSVSGVVMQGLTRNPLVSPFTIGLSSAAAFGASVAIVFSFVLFQGTMGGLVFNAFLFSLFCAFIVFGISWKLGMAPETLILVGIALSYLFSALTAVLQYVADEQQLAAVVQWEFGSLSSANLSQCMVLAVLLLISASVLMLFSHGFNALSVGGEELALSLGVNTVRLKIITGLISVLLTSATISFTGVIGFIGLVGPHIGRMLIGSDHRYLIPFSIISGAALMVLSDMIGRTLLSPVIVPVGIVISFLGVPLFLNLIITRRKRSVS